MTTPLKFVNHNIEDYAIKVTFDPAEGKGNIVYNLSLIKNEDLEFAISVMKDANKTGLSVSSLVRFLEFAIFSPEERKLRGLPSLREQRGSARCAASPLTAF
jgi:repressor of nif and glnA expression